MVGYLRVVVVGLNGFKLKLPTEWYEFKVLISKECVRF